MEPVIHGLMIIIGMIMMITLVKLHSSGLIAKAWTLTRDATQKALTGSPAPQKPPTLPETPAKPYPDFSTAYEASQWGERYATQYPTEQDEPKPIAPRTVFDPPPPYRPKNPDRFDRLQSTPLPRTGNAPPLGCECDDCTNAITLDLNPPKLATVNPSPGTQLRVRDAPHDSSPYRRGYQIERGCTLTITHTRHHYARIMGGGWVLADHLQLSSGTTLASWIDLHTSHYPKTQETSETPPRRIPFRGRP